MSPHFDLPDSPAIAQHFPGAVTSPQPPIYSQYNDSFETRSIESTDSATAMQRQLVPGVYVPTVTFFNPDTEDLDLDTISSHAVRLAKAGVQGITTQGSNGEAVHMSHRERNLVTYTTRKALDHAGYGHMPIIVGCGAQSSRETIELCQEAQANGGDYALVLPPSYYLGLHSKTTITDFFNEVASASPIPILIYNFPPVAGGIDLSSDAIIALAKHSNIVGCKLTCGNTGKLNRIAAATCAATNEDMGSGFMCMGGSADFLLQTLAGGGSGMVGGFANIAPKTCVRLVRAYNNGNMKEARRLQALVARGDWGAIQGGIVGTKAALQAHFGYGGYARRPLPRPNKDETAKWRAMFDEVMAYEQTL